VTSIEATEAFVNDDLKSREERKREQCWNPRQRWRVLQEMIAWVDAQQKVPRNSPAACLAKEGRLLPRANRSPS
jgi:hypothetical protein